LKYEFQFSQIKRYNDETIVQPFIPVGKPTTVLMRVWGAMLASCLTFAIFGTACVTQSLQQSAGIDNLRLPMLTATLDDIDQVYLHDRDISQLSLEALKGLKQIEPGLVIKQQNKTVTVKMGETTIISDEIPETPAGWAKFIVQFLNHAESISYALASASDERLFSAIFNNITLKLDRYSRYSSAKQAAKDRIKRRGIGGIGVTVKSDARGAKIVKTRMKLPAAEAGLKPGDIIVSIGNSNIVGMPLSKIHMLIQGPINVPVSLGIYKNDRTPAKRYLLDRARITSKTVYATYHRGIGIFRISSFNKVTTPSLEREIKKARRNHGNNMRGVIIDIRDNPGGLLDQAVGIADLFLNKGPIISTRGRHKNSIQKFDATPGDIISGLPIAVLINGATASAAEILAAALQDNGRAILIGSSSFGKGTVQTILRLPNDGEIILTWARIVAPSGYALQTLGVLPTVCTVDKSNAKEIVDQFQEVGIKRSRIQLHRRRITDYSNDKQRAYVKKFCPWQPTKYMDLDRRVADLMLKSQGKYARAINLTRIPPGS
jgi:carboxyl-terminal processing protease